MATKTIPVNNYNDSDNYGTSGEAPSLYSDKHYLDGDGFLYGLGMASLRQIVKGKNDDITTKYFYWSDGKSTASKLGLKIPAIAEDLAGAGLWSSTGRLNLMLYTKKNGNVNESGLIIPEDSDTYASGLKINTGKALSIGVDSTDAAAYRKLNVNVDGTTIQINGENKLTVNASAIIGQGLKVVTESGQQYRIDVMPGDYTEIKTMGDSDNQYTAVDVDIPALFAQVTRDKSIYGIGITPNSDASHSNNLYIDGSVLAGDGLQGTGYSDSDSTITPKLKLKIANGSPLYINSTNKALNLRIGDGLIVTNTSTAPTLQFAMGSGFVKSGESIDVDAYNGITVDSNGVSVRPKSNSGIGVDSNGVYLKVASTSEIGGVKLGTDTAPDEGMGSSDHFLLKNGSDAAYVKNYVYNSFPQSSSALSYPYSAHYINLNYSTNTQIDAKIATAISDISGREYKIFPTLPAKGPSQSWADFYDAYKKYIALVSNTGSEPDAYKEYILIVTNESTGECHWEQIGDTEFTTDNFVAKTDVLTQAEVASIVQDVFGF